MGKRFGVLTLLYIMVCSVVFGGDNSSFFFNRHRPKLVVEVILGGLRYDQFYKFRNNYGSGGFREVVSQGVLCTNGSLGSLASPIVGGGVIATGANPLQSGIVGEEWVDLTSNQVKSMFYFENALGVGCNGNEGQLSPLNIIIPTLADQVKWLDSESKVFSLALDPLDAVIHGGKKPNGCYWLDVRSGGFATNTFYSPKLEPWVEGFNNSHRKTTYTSQLWCVELPYSKFHYKLSDVIIKDEDAQFSFDNLVRPKNKNYKRLLETPMGSSLLKDFAIETIHQNDLGKDDKSDLLVINMNSIAKVAQIYGSESSECEDAYYKIDSDLADLVEYLNTFLGKENYVLAITSNHGISPNVQETKSGDKNLFNAMQFKAIISGFLNVKYGADDWVIGFLNRQIYLNRALIYEKNIPLQQIQDHVAALAIQFSGVAGAVTSTALQTNFYGKGLNGKLQNSQFPRHGGDVVINLLPGWIEISDDTEEWKVSGWGSPYNYDTHVPLIFYGKRIEPRIIDTEVDLTDMAPTLCEIMNLTPPHGATGKRIVGF